jgi:hypothetical protein
VVGVQSGKMSSYSQWMKERLEAFVNCEPPSAMFLFYVAYWEKSQNSVMFNAQSGNFCV